MKNSVTKKIVQAKRPYDFKGEDAGCLCCWWGTYSTWRECADVHGNKAKPNIRVNLKGNGKCAYHQQLSMSTCNYTKEIQHTLQFPQVQVYLYAFIYKEKPYARICCILDYLNACVLQKSAWPNSINSSKYTKLRYYWIVVNFTVITKLVECIYRIVWDIFKAAYYKLKS
jgi:hypothetical protein